MSEWIKVKPRTSYPRCRICGKNSWCTISSVNGAICCMRIETGTPMRNGGWLHLLDGQSTYIPPPVRTVKEPVLDAKGIWQNWFEGTDRDWLDRLGVSLGVDTDALVAIGCAKKPDGVAAFPMRNAHGHIIGIRLRNEQGQKYAVKGSKSGLFIPMNADSSISESGTLWLTEGPSDLAAALTIGLMAIGRAACLGQEDFIIQYIRLQKIRRLVIVSDLDEAGLRGAAKLQTMLPVPSVILTPPAKDLRQFLIYGGGYLTAQSMLNDLCWTVPQIKA